MSPILGSSPAPHSPRPASAAGRRRIARRALAGLAAVGVSAGCALAAPYNPENLPAEQIAQVTEICRSVVGLQPGERAFSSCLDSLSRSAAKLDRNSALQTARHDCLAKGLQPGDPALARCEVAATDDASRPVAASAGVTAAPAAPVKSYFYASWREAHQRQRMACAALGYDPAGVGFYNCVANLQASLFQSAHPST